MLRPLSPSRLSHLQSPHVRCPLLPVAIVCFILAYSTCCIFFTPTSHCTIHVGSLAAAAIAAVASVVFRIYIPHGALVLLAFFWDTFFVMCSICLLYRCLGYAPCLAAFTFASVCIPPSHPAIGRILDLRKPLPSLLPGIPNPPPPSPHSACCYARVRRHGNVNELSRFRPKGTPPQPDSSSLKDGLRRNRVDRARCRVFVRGGRRTSNVGYRISNTNRRTRRNSNGDVAYRALAMVVVVASSVDRAEVRTRSIGFGARDSLAARACLSSSSPTSRWAMEDGRCKVSRKGIGWRGEEGGMHREGADLTREDGARRSSGLFALI
ncbi:hypothetical protein C8Q73DRAFT_114246 [Cubamyces lactineus]|nr:hypothetical protein C8Q73DRAFT_114246 [Cubamyces lactineus]